MKLTPIVMAAYGSTTASRVVYDHFERVVRGNFAGHPLYWVGTSERVRELIRAQGQNCFPAPELVVEQLVDQGVKQVVVQSLHILPAAGYVRLRHLGSRATLATAIGAPLLYSPEDYRAVAHCLAPLIESRLGQAILLVGHGTSHPAWTAFPALESFLRRRFGNRVFVGVVEKFPGGASEVVAEIVAGRYQQVCLVPFLLTAGMHFHRDLVGEGAESWQSRLDRSGVDVEVISEGIGLLPGIAEIFCGHIRHALEQLAMSE